MPASIGVNLRVTGHCRQGGRKYMEDFFSVAYQQTEDERDLEYAFFGIYDGHGGAEAAAFAKEHLMETIVKQKNFWSDNDADVLRAIKDGYIATHYAMWKEQEKWPKTASGLPSTAGTTASVAFIRRGKIYIGHVGDSGIILGYQEPGCPDWKARPLTKEHKPESALEMMRIESCGGKVVSKSGVPRVVWNRPRIGHQGPVRRSTPIDEIPFLAVARSLGDLWSYNSQLDEFVVSPDPDCSVIPIDTSTFRCLIFGTDGLYNMLSPQMAVHIVQQAERHNENAALSDDPNKIGWLNPSKCLVEKALERWSTTKMRADNTSVVTLMLDPPGPPRAQVLKNKKKNGAYPDSGLKIVTRYEDNDQTTSSLQEGDRKIEVTATVNTIEKNLISTGVNTVVSCTDVSSNSTIGGGDSLPKASSEKAKPDSKAPNFEAKDTNSAPVKTTMLQPNSFLLKTDTNIADADVNFVQKTRESLSYDVRKSLPDSEVTSNNCSSSSVDQEVSKSNKFAENIQINEISSSSNDSYDIEDDNFLSQFTKGDYSVDSTKTLIRLETVEKKVDQTSFRKDKKQSWRRSTKYSIRQTKNCDANCRKNDISIKNSEKNFKLLRPRPPGITQSQELREKVIKSEPKESPSRQSPRNLKRPPEEVQQLTRKRSRSLSSRDSCIPRKQPKRNSNPCGSRRVGNTKTKHLGLKSAYSKMRSKVIRTSMKAKQSLMKIDDVILKQKIRALQKIITQKTPNYNSGIIFENKNLQPKKSNAKIKTESKCTTVALKKSQKRMKKPLKENPFNDKRMQLSLPSRERTVKKIVTKVSTQRKTVFPRRSVRKVSTKNELRARTQRKFAVSKDSTSLKNMNGKRTRNSEAVRNERAKERTKSKVSTVRRTSPRSVCSVESIGISVKRNKRSGVVLTKSLGFQACKRSCC